MRLSASQAVLMPTSRPSSSAVFITISRLRLASRSIPTVARVYFDKLSTSFLDINNCFRTLDTSTPLSTNFAGLEAALNAECARLDAERCAELVEVLQQAMLQALLLEEMFLSLLKIHAGRAGMRFKEYRRILRQAQHKSP